MELITQDEWNSFYATMKDAWDTFGQKMIIWQRRTRTRSQFNEGEYGPPTPVELRVLINWNIMRTWPIDMNTDSGELDRQTAQLYFFKPYLAELGYIAPEGYFIFNRDYDRFIIDGITYEPEGDTPASQARDKDQWVTVIVKREETATGNQV